LNQTREAGAIEGLNKNRGLSAKVSLRRELLWDSRGILRWKTRGGACLERGVRGDLRLLERPEV